MPFVLCHLAEYYSAIVKDFNFPQMIGPLPILVVMLPLSITPLSTKYLQLD